MEECALPRSGTSARDVGWRIRADEAASAISTSGVPTVVMPGFQRKYPEGSPKPIRDRSRGISKPASRSARNTPTVSAFDPSSSAVGRSNRYEQVADSGARKIQVRGTEAAQRHVLAHSGAIVRLHIARKALCSGAAVRLHADVGDAAVAEL